MTNIFYLNCYCQNMVIILSNTILMLYISAPTSSHSDVVCHNQPPPGLSCLPQGAILSSQLSAIITPPPIPPVTPTGNPIKGLTMFSSPVLSPRGRLTHPSLYKSATQQLLLLHTVYSPLCLWSTYLGIYWMIRYFGNQRLNFLKLIRQGVTVYSKVLKKHVA